MKMRACVTWTIAGIMALMLATMEAAAQTPAPELRPAISGAQFTVEQLDQMLAPIALYPDPLLAQILMAATYPLEIVQADRWLQNPYNATLKGDQLTAALEPQPWDPSVKSLIPFPQILRMMDDNLTWTEQLGDAFLADQPAVMDAVQRLRQKAQAAGKLQSTPQGVVSTQGQTIIIEPPAPEIVYVPVYDPYVVYGIWPYPDFPPYYFTSYFNIVIIDSFGFGWFGFGIIEPLWGWGHWDWRHHRIDIDRDRFNHIHAHHPPLASGTWRHDPSHRGGVPYRDVGTRERFEGERGAPDVRRSFRGYPATAVPQPQPYQAPQSQPAPQPYPSPQSRPTPHPAPQSRPSPQPYPAPGNERREAPQSFRPPQPYRAPSPPAFESFGRGADVRMQTERGQASRQSMPIERGPAERGNEGRQQFRQQQPASGGRERR